jgi:AcrR family transcriptional regulator
MPTETDKRAPRKQHERSAESAKRLLDAAIELIAEKGFERTTAAEIGERAGYSREMVRARYGSKEELLKSLFDNEYEARLLEPPSEDLPGLELALHPLALMSNEAAESPDLLRAFFVLCFESVGPVPVLAPWMRNWFSRYESETAAALRAGQADGSVRSDLDPEIEANFLITHGAGLGFRWVLEPRPGSFSQVLDRWAEQLRSSWST